MVWKENKYWLYEKSFSIDSFKLRLIYQIEWELTVIDLTMAYGRIETVKYRLCLRSTAKFEVVNVQTSFDTRSLSLSLSPVYLSIKFQLKL